MRRRLNNHAPAAKYAAESTVRLTSSYSTCDKIGSFSIAIDGDVSLAPTFEAAGGRVETS